MSKKTKQTTAQDLIDSLLDEPGSESSLSSRQQPPPLPDGLITTPKRGGDLSFAEKSSFTLDPVTPKTLARRNVAAVTPSRAGRGASGPKDDAFDEQSLRFDLGEIGETSSPLRVVGESQHDTSTTGPVSSQAPTVVGAKAPGASRLLDANPSAESEAAVDKTIRLKRSSPELDRSEKDIKSATQVKFGVAQNASSARRPTTGSSSGSGAVFTSAEAALKQSESLNIAQLRINELESELERVRRENERLASAGETLRRRSDELLSRVDSAEHQSRESKRTYEKEKNVLRGQLAAKEREAIELRSKIEEMETRLEQNFQKIRVREQKLAHQLEIVKMDNAALVSTKDEMIMRLKREVDQLKFEIESSKTRSQELYGQFKKKQETIGRVVRALRIALTILEGDEESPVKKADSE